MTHGAADQARWGGAETGEPADGALYLFPELARASWWRALLALERVLGAAATEAAVEAAYARLLGALAASGYADLRRAAATELLGGHGPLDAYAARSVPAGLLFALERDLGQIDRLTAKDYFSLAAGRLAADPPPLNHLAEDLPPGVLGEAVAAAEAALAAETPKLRVTRFVETLSRFGSGPAALHRALRFEHGELVGLTHPDLPEWSQLVGLDQQLERLAANVEALLAGAAAHHTLLYGPRGSGKSTAVRGLLARFAGSALRLVEVPPSQLERLPDLIERLRRQPTSFVLYVDDLAFEEGETGYRPLKSLLEGSLARRPANLIVVATSNRRHLVRERISDRPMPEDDVHGWDTHHEKLALADRFGLTITFPSTGQRDYLQLVRALAALRGVSDFSEEQAVRFAEWGNGYSGRTARQYLDELVGPGAFKPDS
ncbi:MAG: DUF815 domain-containing protein [Trueperaceae bacterium]